VLLAISAVILGEKIQAEEWFTYIPIWCAVGILVLEGMWHIYLQQRKRHALITNIEKFSERVRDNREK
jgi:chloramphenicol-sensitive protein RarD